LASQVQSQLVGGDGGCDPSTVAKFSATLPCHIYHRLADSVEATRHFRGSVVTIARGRAPGLLYEKHNFAAPSRRGSSYVVKMLAFAFPPFFGRTLACRRGMPLCPRGFYGMEH